MPYRIIGGTKFYERAEIKDCLAYLRIVYQQRDDLAFERIINVPKRSIGETTVKQISEFSKKNNLCIYDGARKLLDTNQIKPKTKIGLSTIIKFIEKWKNDYLNKISHIKLLQIILDESGYSQCSK